MADQLDISRDPHNIPTYDLALNTVAENFPARLAADTDTPLTVPAGVRLAFVSASDFVFIWSDAAITLPILGAGFAAGAGFQSAQVINVESVTTLHFRARNACDITVLFKA